LIFCVLGPFWRCPILETKMFRFTHHWPRTVKFFKTEHEQNPSTHSGTKEVHTHTHTHTDTHKHIHTYIYTYIHTVFQKPLICIQGGPKMRNSVKISRQNFFTITTLSHTYHVYEKVRISRVGCVIPTLKHTVSQKTTIMYEMTDFQIFCSNHPVFWCE
jgi:hypothetical protein